MGSDDDVRVETTLDADVSRAVTAEGRDLAEGSERQTEQAAEESQLQRVAEHIRSESGQVRLVEPAVFLQEPFSLTKDELEELWGEMAEVDQYRDIVRTVDERTGETFVHSDVLITVPYAQLMLRKRADDPVYMIAATVREHSEVYPQPLSVAVFEWEPFNLRTDEILACVEAMKVNAEYTDIKPFDTSNGVVYLFSDRYMTEPMAKARAEWVEVEQHRNP